MTLADCIPHLIAGEKITRGDDSVRGRWHIQLERFDVGLERHGVLQTFFGHIRMGDNAWSPVLQDLEATDWEVCK